MLVVESKGVALPTLSVPHLLPQKVVYVQITRRSYVRLLNWLCRRLQVVIRLGKVSLLFALCLRIHRFVRAHVGRKLFTPLLLSLLRSLGHPSSDRGNRAGGCAGLQVFFHFFVELRLLCWQRSFLELIFRSGVVVRTTEFTVRRRLVKVVDLNVDMVRHLLESHVLFDKAVHVLDVLVRCKDLIGVDFAVVAAGGRPAHQFHELFECAPECGLHLDGLEVALDGLLLLQLFFEGIPEQVVPRSTVWNELVLIQVQVHLLKDERLAELLLVLRQTGTGQRQFCFVVLV